MASTSAGCEGTLIGNESIDLPPRIELPNCANETLMLPEPSREPDDQHHNSHDPDTDKHGEHMALFDAVPYAQRTHLAVRSGPWFASTTWHSGSVPGDGARAIVPEGILVDYGEESEARLDWVRVDGALVFRPDAHSRMVVETLVVGGNGALSIGTVCEPIAEDASVEIVITNRGDIDVARDRHLLTRGLVSHGRARIHGHAKTPHAKVAVDPLAGDTSITMQEAPTDWSVGDTIVIAGTHYARYRWNGTMMERVPSQDEVRVISAITDEVVLSFAEPLVHDHDSPREDLKTSVGNYTRNVTIRSEQGDATPRHQRGHVMFMHSDDVDIRYAAFWDLGRTNKDIDEPDAQGAAEFTAIASASNVKGRYPFHFHRLGFTDMSQPAMAVGNAVFRSPGWGYVHHDTNAVFHNNVSFDTFGAAFVAETGNETGAWTNNLAILSEAFGRNPPKEFTGNHFNLGRLGSGFFFQGRAVRSVGNIAASVNGGFNYFHRGPSDNDPTDNLDGVLVLKMEHFPYPEVFWRDPGPAPVPILSFHHNEAFAADFGVYVTKAGPNQGHDIHTVMDDLKAWNVKNGAEFTYTSHYVVKNFDLVGEEGTGGAGVVMGTITNEMTVVSPRIEGFGAAVDFNKTPAGEPGDPSFLPTLAIKQFVLADAELINNQEDYRNYHPESDTILNELVEDRVELELVTDILHQTVGTPIKGRHFDSLGMTPIPSGNDNYDLALHSVLNVVDNTGYYRNEDGSAWYILEYYFSDRGTGEIHKVGVPVRFSERVYLGNPHTAWKNAQELGPIDFENRGPIVQNHRAAASINGSVVIDVLEGSSDPEGDTVVLDRPGHATHGTVLVRVDGLVEYTPDLDFSGQDQFKYWLEDGQGNFSPGWVFVGVGEAPEGSTELPRTPTIRSIPRLPPLPNGTEVSGRNWRPWVTPDDERSDRLLSEEGASQGEVIGHDIVDTVLWYQVRFADDTEGWLPQYDIPQHVASIRFIEHLRAAEAQPWTPGS